MINVYTKKKKQKKQQSELRYDCVRDEWNIIACNRTKRPDNFNVQKTTQKYEPHKDVFLVPEEVEKQTDVLVYYDDANEWTTRVLLNRFPLIEQGSQGHENLSYAHYYAMTAYGHHEIVVTRDPHRLYAHLENKELAEVIDAFRERCKALMQYSYINNVFIFHNHGAKAGASIMHPHSQILALPIESSVIKRELRMCEDFEKTQRKNIFDFIVDYELECGKRIVYTNEKYIVFCPFSPMRSYHMRIISRKRQPYFEKITFHEELLLADALSHALKALENTLDNPDFNFYIHTAPCDGRTYDLYSFYIDIFPYTNTIAGFEFSTNINVSTITPEHAARQLKETIII